MASFLLIKLVMTITFRCKNAAKHCFALLKSFTDEGSSKLPNSTSLYIPLYFKSRIYVEHLKPMV